MNMTSSIINLGTFAACTGKKKRRAIIDSPMDGLVDIQSEPVVRYKYM